MNKKSMKKSLAIVLAMLLVCVISVAGTLAYLQASSGPVTNTFAVGNLFDEDPANPNDGFVLREHKATYAGEGVYTLGTEEVTENTYNPILPGVAVDKDPFVRVTNLKEDAYVFIEVVDNLSDKLTATVDTTGTWTETNFTGEHGGKIYVCTTKLNGDVTNPVTHTLNILAGKQVAVDGEYKGEPLEKLTFYGYMIQAAGLDDTTKLYDAAKSAFKFV